MRLGLLLLLLAIALALFLYLIIGSPISRTPTDAKQRIVDGKYDVVIDVRTPEEWKQGHHPKSISIPIGEFVTTLPATVPNKDARILIVCRKGIRSHAAAQMAIDLGYTNVEWVSGLHNGLAD